jgi:hypothetical protein
MRWLEGLVKSGNGLHYLSVPFAKLLGRVYSKRVLIRPAGRVF